MSLYSRRWFCALPGSVRGLARASSVNRKATHSRDDREATEPNLEREPTAANRMDLRQSLGHGRGILCPYARGHRIGTGKCADWRCHYTWNQKSQIRPSRALAASFLAGRYGACLKGRSEQSFGTIVDGHAPGEPPSPSPSITRLRTPAALAAGVHPFQGHRSAVDKFK